MGGNTNNLFAHLWNRQHIANKIWLKANKLVQLNTVAIASYNISIVVFMCTVYMLSIDRTLISDFVTNLFMRSLSGMILLYVAVLFYTEGIFA